MSTEYKQKLLTIAIPTYNRAHFLNVCLNQIAKQLPGYEQLVDVMVSNNCSTDTTEELVNSYIERGVPITYFCNSENIGAERNVVQCFEKATGKYVLILGDDDLILDGALRKIIEFLRENEVGVLYLTSYGFKDDYLSEQPKKNKTGIHIFSAPEKFLEKVHYWVTFLSGNVVNKSQLPAKFDSSYHIGTNLPHVNWILSSLFMANQNAVILDYVIAAKAENTGGYKLCEVFGKNFKGIMVNFIKRPEDKKVLLHIENNLLLTFFPRVIAGLRSGKSGYTFSGENFHQELVKYYGRNKFYWMFTFPIMILPAKLSTIGLKFDNLIERIVNGKNN